MLQFKHLLEQRSFRCSGGECQRVLLGSLFASEPEVLLLDEPTAFLDGKAKEFFYKAVLNFRSNHPTATIVLTEHENEEFLREADQIWHFTADKTVQALTLQEYRMQTSELLPLVPQNFTSDRIWPQKMVDFHNCEFVSGTIVCIFGENGVGKTTLLRALAKYLTPNLAYIAQNPEAHFLTQSVRAEILLSQKGLSNAQVEALLGQFSLPLSALDRSPFLLSEGEKRRLSILLGVILDKPVLLYDEPTFGQDRARRTMIENTILNLRMKNTLQVVLTHNETFAKKIADKIYRLEGGKLWEQEP